MDVAANNKSKAVVLVAVVAVSLVAAYAALTRFDSASGPPDTPLISSLSKDDSVEPLRPIASAAQPSRNPVVDQLADRISGLVAEERSLPQARLANAPTPSPAMALSLEGLARPAESLSSDALLQNARANIAEAEAIIAGDYQLRAARAPKSSDDHRLRVARVVDLRQQLNELTNASSRPLSSSVTE